METTTSNGVRVMKYKARSGARFTDTDAGIIGAELERLGTVCTAEMIVAEAKKKASALHPYFDWDNDSAAHKHRMEQARYYTRNIEVVVITPEGREQTRGWHHVSIEHEAAAEDGTAYVASATIRRDQSLGDQVIRNALRELESWQRRYAEYRLVFGEVFKAIPKAKKRIATKRKKRELQAA